MKPAAFTFAAAIAILTGCASAPVTPGDSAPVEDHPFRPAAMRAHPLTRIVRENNQPVRVEAHVEFFDRWGHTVKALGALRFELRDASAGDAASSVAEPVRWEPIDLQNPAASSRAYDPATGTYWVRLTLPARIALGGSPTLDVVFTTLDGRRLSSTIELE